MVFCHALLGAVIGGIGFATVSFCADKLDRGGVGEAEPFCATVGLPPLCFGLATFGDMLVIGPSPIQNHLALASALFNAESIFDPRRANGSASNISFAISISVRSFPSDLTHRRRVCSSPSEYSVIVFRTGIGALAGVLSAIGVVGAKMPSSGGAEICCKVRSGRGSSLAATAF